MKHNDKLKYVICINKKNRILHILVTAISFISSLAIILTLNNRYSLQGSIVIILCALFFILTGMISCYSLTKSVKVYSDYIIYKSLFCRKTYMLSNIEAVKEKEDSLNATWDINGTHYYDIVTTFYDKNNIKLFSFGRAYVNVQQLKKDIIAYKKHKA